ncbi:Geminivirus MSV 27Kd coat protein [Parasponia andersonii]|uniref:Geminivirus MSV 27Kd coat protein n=1 Tax=Parasponia andersonii TaxID=3476 RepID=A0A2P5AM41_PARAD|nr:Geminivirus MSV 27Kd coat protein [Parasponia andersonii]
MDGSLLSHHQELFVHQFIILDQQPDETLPSREVIFQGVSPWLYNVQHDAKCHFIVKRRWTQRLTSVGEVTSVTSKGPTAYAVDSFEYFDRGINIRSDRKNNTSGQYADLEKGALLWVGIVTSSIPNQTQQYMKVNYYYDHTLYFKSL